MRSARKTGMLKRRRRGVVTFEWILLITLLVIGVIGGLSAVRNAIICELGDLAECISAISICECAECGDDSCPPQDSDCPPYGRCCRRGWWSGCGDCDDWDDD